MALSYEFFIARAEESARDAETAALENVRDRALRSEAAWRDMAERALKVAHERAKSERERLCRQSEA